MAIAKRHCRTCRCNVKLKRHVCAKCGARKDERFMEARRGDYGAFGKQRWQCKNGERCKENPNYGG